MAGRIRKWSLRIFVLMFLLLLAAWYFLWVRPISPALFYDKAFLEFALKSPQTLSSIRLLEGIGIRGHNAHLDDISQERNDEFHELLLKDIEILKRYDRDNMTGQDAISYDIMSFYLEQQRDGNIYRYHGYPVNQMGGVQNSFPQFMSSIHHIGDQKDVTHYISRLNEVGRFFDQLLVDLRLREERDIIPPKFAVERVLHEMRGFIGVSPQENILYSGLLEKLNKIESFSDADKEELMAEVEDAVTSSVYPAYQKLITYFEGLQNKDLTNHGVWNLPDGEAYYQFRLEETTTGNYTADEIHQIGLDEVARINKQMDELLRNQGLTEGSVGERMAALGEQQQFLYPNTDQGREDILEEYRAIIRDIETGMPELFDITIKSPVEVKRVPEFREEGSAGAFYQGPAPDGSRPGVFYANLRDLTEHPKFGMRTLAYHEAIPGHHYQIAVSTELQGLPQFRKFLGFTAFTEGWALYAERLAAEAGFQEDPYSNLGRLQAEIWRAVRLVVDTGLHHKRWTREQAIDYMKKHTGIKQSDVVTEIERYLVWPGQATAYKVGMIKILELRERAKAELGDDFDIRKFHRAVLENGAVPLFILEQQIDRYISANKTQH